MSGNITTLYPDEEKLKEFIVLHMPQVFDASKLSSSNDPVVMLAYALHCFFLVLRFAQIKLMFIGPAGGRIVVSDINLDPSQDPSGPLAGIRRSYERDAAHEYRQ